VIFLVTNRYLDVQSPQPLRQFFRKVELRTAGTIVDNLQVSERGAIGDIVTQRLDNGLLGGEPSGDKGGAVSAVAELLSFERPQNSVEEAIAETLHRTPDPRDVNYIYPNGVRHIAANLLSKGEHNR